MVDPLSVTVGIGVAVAVLLAGLGLYYLGQRPAHMVDMTEVAAYHRHRSAAEALEQDVDDSE